MNVCMWDINFELLYLIKGSVCIKKTRSTLFTLLVNISIRLLYFHTPEPAAETFDLRTNKRTKLHIEENRVYESYYTRHHF